jgi:tetraacyldisaccharide 4'-kinase
MTLPGKIILWLPAALYRLVTGVRNRLYDTGIIRSYSFSLPVICIGNITAGGTGKTPHVMYLAEKLAAMTDVAVLSRGYLRKSRGFRMITASDIVSDAGDEPLMMANRLTAAKVFVDRDRANGIRDIIHRYPETGTVILDDGFQHRAVKAGMNIILTSFDRLMTRDRILPLGRLRESLSAIKRADMIIVTKVPPSVSPQEKDSIRRELTSAGAHDIYFTGLKYEKIVPLFGGSNRDMTAAISVLLVTGIASPSPLVKYVSDLSSNVRHIAFPDHHRFTARDIDAIELSFNGLPGDDRIIITTEKDAVRLKEIINIADRLAEVFYFMPVGIEFIDNETGFLSTIYGYAGKDKEHR